MLDYLLGRLALAVPVNCPPSTSMAFIPMLHMRLIQDSNQLPPASQSEVLPTYATKNVSRTRFEPTILDRKSHVLYILLGSVMSPDRMVKRLLF